MGPNRYGPSLCVFRVALTPKIKMAIEEYLNVGWHIERFRALSDVRRHDTAGGPSTGRVGAAKRMYIRSNRARDCARSLVVRP